MVTMTKDERTTYLTGVYNGQDKPLVLGENRYSWNVGGFYIGFTVYPHPATVRIFFEPFVLGERYDAIGLINVGHITYQNHPISPQTFGMGLENRQPYNYQFPFDTKYEHYWADMTDLATLKGNTSGNNLLTRTPFYPFNAYSSQPDLSVDDFYNYPLSNGSLTRSPKPTEINRSLCASLAGRIDFDADYPPRKEIESIIGNLREREVIPYAKKRFDASDIRDKGYLKLSLELLEVDDIDSASDLSELPTISEIETGDAYAIISMVDNEDEGPIFVTFRDPSDAEGRTIVMYVVDEDVIEEKQFERLRQSFENTKQEFNGRAPLFFTLVDGMPINAPSSGSGRGNSGLVDYPFIFKGDVDPVVAFTYYTIAIGMTDGKITNCFGCLEWTVWREFSRDRLEYGALNILAPKLNFEVSFAYGAYLYGLAPQDHSFVYPVINTYQKALGS